MEFGKVGGGTGRDTCPVLVAGNSLCSVGTEGDEGMGWVDLKALEILALWLSIHEGLGGVVNI